MTVIFISGGPDNMKLYPNTSIYTLTIGKPLGPVVCSADCTPTCSFQWKKDTQTIVNNATLSFHVENRSSAGNYTCVATRGDSVKDTGISLFVRCKYISSLYSILTVFISSSELCSGWAIVITFCPSVRASARPLTLSNDNSSKVTDAICP